MLCISKKTMLFISNKLDWQHLLEINSKLYFCVAKYNVVDVYDRIKFKLGSILSSALWF